MAKKKTSGGGGGFSLRTADATEGGGIDGALATIAEIEFVDEFTYGGRQKDKPQAALRCEYHIEGFDKPWEQHYSVGPTERFEVVEDGDGIISAGKQGSLNKKSTIYAFFEALEAAAESSGVDLDEILPPLDGYDTQSVRPLEGRRVRLTNVKFTPVSGDPKDLVVIGAFVDDEPASNGKSAKSSKKGKVNVEEQAEEVIVALLEDGPVKSADLPNAIFKAHKKDPHVKAMMQLAFKKAWVTDEDRPWTVDKKGVLTAVKDDNDE